MKPIHFKSVAVAAFLFLLASASLQAETRTYQSGRAIQDFIPAFIDQLGGLQFKIVKNYNEATDGKLGFVLALMPGQRYCDISFVENNGKGTLLRITTQDRSDAALFSQIASRMGMTEPGLSAPPAREPGPAWPSTSR